MGLPHCFFAHFSCPGSSLICIQDVCLGKWVLGPEELIMMSTKDKLIGGLEMFGTCLFFHLLGIIIPTDKYFSEGQVYHQPANTLNHWIWREGLFSLTLINSDSLKPLKRRPRKPRFFEWDMLKLRFHMRRFIHIYPIISYYSYDYHIQHCYMYYHVFISHS